MKKNVTDKFLIFLLGIVFTASHFISCASTPIKDVPAKEDYETPLTTTEEEKNEDTHFDFIGFKSNINLLSVCASAADEDSFLMELIGASEIHDAKYASGYEYWRDFRDSKPMKRFPTLLEENKIAADETVLYFGDFTPQDLVVYKGNHRYVTFIDVLESHLGWMDTGRIQKSFSSAGGILLSGGILGALTVCDSGFKNLSGEEKAEVVLSGAGIVLGLACLVPLVTKPKTAFVAHVRYALCIYDTAQKKLVERKIINFDRKDTFTGSFESENTDKTIVYNFYGQCLADNMFREYEKICQKW